jgi:DNA adenine methylase
MLSNPEMHDEYPMEPVAAVRPPAAYMGGKKNLAKRLVARIDQIPHLTFAEVFVGMGGVFFRRNRRPKVEVINDWSEDVSTFFRVLQHHYVAFLDMIRFQIGGRAGFEKLAAIDPASLTDLQRSARFLYLQRQAFGGKVTQRRFGVSPSQPSNFDMTKLPSMLEAVHERLTAVTIERLPWLDFIKRYDRPGTLFYLDPPYFGCETDYGRDMFGRSDFEAMAAALRSIEGRFILSLNDHPEVRRIFAGFAMEEVGVRYTIGGVAKASVAGELIISN